MKKKIVSYNDKKASANKGAVGRSEKDIDDLVHSGEDETTAAQSEEDPDDKVHRIKRSGLSIGQADTNMEDPDDLVHGQPEEDEE